jgi:hypothetical protein
MRGFWTSVSFLIGRSPSGEHVGKHGNSGPLPAAIAVMVI